VFRQIGTSHLAKRLNTILMTHIKNSLPEIKARITQQIAETEDELQSYGSPLLDSHTTMVRCRSFVLDCNV